MARSHGTTLILVVCDDADAREICQACLRHAGYHVVAVDEPDRALDVARRLRPDLVVTSFPTATSTGESVTEAIRADGAVSGTPILSLSAWIRPEELERARVAGVSESLAMPVDVGCLVGAVRRLVAGRPLPTSQRGGTWGGLQADPGEP